MKQQRKKTSDEVGSFIEHIVRNNKRAFRLLYLSSIISIVLLFICLYFLFFKKDRVVLLSPEGKPDIVNSISDRVFANEAQSFIGVVTGLVFERSYVDFMNQNNTVKVYKTMEPFFSPEIYRSFWESYIKSQFIKSVVDGKLIVKVKVSSPFDLKVTPKGEVFGIGTVELLNFTPDTAVAPTLARKIVEIRFFKGTRTLQNPYGFYVISLTERGTM